MDQNIIQGGSIFGGHVPFLKQLLISCDRNRLQFFRLGQRFGELLVNRSQDTAQVPSQHITVVETGVLGVGIVLLTVFRFVLVNGGPLHELPLILLEKLPHPPG